MLPPAVAGLVAIVHRPASQCSGQPQVLTSKEMKCHLDSPRVRGSKKIAFLVMLFSLRAVARSAMLAKRRARMRATIGKSWQSKSCRIRASGL